MKKRLLALSLFAAAASFLGTARPASATVVDFESIVGPSFYVLAGPAQHRVFNTVDGQVTVDGGVVLTNTFALPADQTSVYGTARVGDAVDPSYTNPLTITFEHPITNFYLDVLNGLATNVTYEMSDNAANVADFTLAPNLSSGQKTIGFAASGTQVQIFATPKDVQTWDFLIDNIHFNEALPATTPEPTPLVLMGFGLLGVAGIVRAGRK